MSVYSSEDIKRALELAFEKLHPYILFCHSDRKKEMENFMKDNKDICSCFELKTCQDIDKDKLYIIDREKMNSLAFTRGSSKSFVGEYDFESTIFSKGGEK